MIFIVILCFFVVLWPRMNKRLPETVYSPEEITVQKKEKDYAEMWCSHHDGILEHLLADRTRIDCLSSTYAVEVDFAPKWKEAIGQSLHYAELSDHEAGIVLIVRSERDMKYLAALERVIEAYELPIKVWTTSDENVSVVLYSKDMKRGE